MMKILSIATFFIAAYAVSTGATAQKVYRCGDTYSQAPCEGAAAVEVDDSRSKSDKIAADKASQRDLKQANAMEKARLKQEKEALKTNPAHQKDTSKPDRKAESPGQTQKKSKDKKEPEFFTAKGAAVEKKKD